jgi:hypothetical protein
MLGRIDSAVPQGTSIVILEPGPNDRGTKAERAANIEAIRHRLRARSIQVVVYDQKLPEKYRWDGVHFTVAGHALIAHALLPRVMALVVHKPAEESATTTTTGQSPKPDADHQPADAASNASHSAVAPPPSQTATAHPPH